MAGELSGLDGQDLADGFDQTEHIKILYLAQWYNLQKLLRMKLNRFGLNQITRFEKYCL